MVKLRIRGLTPTQRQLTVASGSEWDLAFASFYQSPHAMPGQRSGPLEAPVQGRAWRCLARVPTALELTAPLFFLVAQAFTSHSPAEAACRTAMFTQVPGVMGRGPAEAGQLLTDRLRKERAAVRKVQSDS